MGFIAIVGCGALGGAVAHKVAGRDRVASIFAPDLVRSTRQPAVALRLQLRLDGGERRLQPVVDGGAAGRDELVAWLRPEPGRQVYRIRFHRIGDDPRIALRHDDRLDDCGP